MARALLYLGPMSKRSKRSRRSTPDRSVATDVVTQLEVAFRNPHAALIGAVLGGLVPWFGRTLAHEEIPSAWSTGSTGLALILLAVVIGCGIFSGISVYKFGSAAFGDARKALGFVLALEGVMLVSHGTTSAVALAVLILINAVANGSVIALARDATKRRCAADARRTATRRSRATGTSPTAKYPSPPFPVVEAEEPVARPSRRRTPASVRWSPVMADDVTDADIVSEHRLLA